MCGIFAVWGDISTADKVRMMRHATDVLSRRGPDAIGEWISERFTVVHTRLSVVAPESGHQPLESDKHVVAVNGEIYNFLEWSQTASDSLSVLRAMDSDDDLSTTLCRMNGMFSFVAFNKEDKSFVYVRDRVGITPLYTASTKNYVIVTSLLRAIPDGMTAMAVEPGTYTRMFVNRASERVKWAPTYSVDHWPLLPVDTIKTRLATELTKAVERRLMGDVPWAVLLSGGLDSSIVASIASRVCKRVRPDFPALHTFCIGLKGSPDLKESAKMAKYLGSVHHEITYDIKDGLDVLPHVISAIESYDVTTVRASVPMWLLARHVKTYGFKMVLSGEGSDELFGGYSYFWHCPSPEEMALECASKLSSLWAYDCLRANKSMGDFGVETRVPFLDKDVVHVAMNMIDPVHKMSHSHPDGRRAEKWLLRDTFREIVHPDIASRTKAQFSDAVGSEWIQALKSHAESEVTDDMMQHAKRRFPFQTPATKEAYFYRHIFAECVGGWASRAVRYVPDSVACSSAQGAKWCDEFEKDPSGNLTRYKAPSDSE